MELKNKSIIAITGPSGVGKTTLGEKLASNEEITIARQCTTRKKRSDDKDGFYRYLSHEEYKKLYDSGEFLISSGDSSIISREYGNFYGVLINDCIDAWKNSDIIILIVSYKDIDRLVELKRKGLDIDIVNLCFNDLEFGISERLNNDIRRNHSESDIHSRINSAKTDQEKYGEAIRLFAKCTVYTDILDIEETYNRVCTALKIKERKHE